MKTGSDISKIIVLLVILLLGCVTSLILSNSTYATVYMVLYMMISMLITDGSVKIVKKLHTNNGGGLLNYLKIAVGDIICFLFDVAILTVLYFNSGISLTLHLINCFLIVIIVLTCFYRESRRSR